MPRTASIDHPKMEYKFSGPITEKKYRQKFRAVQSKGGKKKL